MADTWAKIQSVKRQSGVVSSLFSAEGRGEFNTRAAQVHSLRFSGMRCKPAVGLNTKEVVEMIVRRK